MASHAQIGHIAAPIDFFSTVRRLLSRVELPSDYQLVVDVWEGQHDVDFSEMKRGGVAAAIIRLNDISGGHHKDAKFDELWAAAAQADILRAPYFVYNPWIDGSENYKWLLKNAPGDIKRIFVDAEVIYSNYPPATYAAEFDEFVRLCQLNWQTAIYTAEWFLPYLSSWPTTPDYWWAQYPLTFYPDQETVLAWDDLRDMLAGNPYPNNAQSCPGVLRMWQFTGDRLILPGSTSALDVNLFYGDYADLTDWIGGHATPPSKPEDKVTEPIHGVTLHEFERHGARAVAMIVDLTKNDAIVSRFRGSRKTLGTWMQETGAHGAVNGDGWSSAPEYNVPNSIGASLGAIYQTYQKDGRPYINITETGAIQITDRVNMGWLFNAISFDRFLVINGQVNQALYSRPKEKNARTLAGKTASGKLVLVCVEGYDIHPTKEPKGWTFIECAEVLLELGCIDAGNLDGGGSTQARLLGKVILPFNDDGRMGPEYERYLPNIIGFKSKGEVVIQPEPEPEPPDGGDMQKWKVIETVRMRTEPNFYSQGVGDAVVDLEFERTESMPDSQPVDTSGPIVIWEKYHALWVPRRHHTKDIRYLELIGGTPPEPPEPPVDSEIISITNISGHPVPIHENEMEAAQVIGQIEKGDSVLVFAHIVNDIDKQIYGSKWSRLSDKSGFVQAEYFERPPGRRVTAILYVDESGNVYLTEYE